MRTKKTNPLRDAMEGNPWSEEELANWEFEQAEKDYYETLPDAAFGELETKEEDTND